MSAAHTPGPKYAAMQALATQGFTLREAWIDNYHDGLHTVKKVGPHRIEVYVGNADDGEYGDLHYAPVVCVDDKVVATGIATVEKAARIADFRAAMCRAAIAKATGSPLTQPDPLTPAMRADAAAFASATCLDGESLGAGDAP